MTSSSERSQRRAEPGARAEGYVGASIPADDREGTRMMRTKKAVYFFCVGSIERVAGNVLRSVMELYDLHETGLDVDGHRVLRTTDEAGAEYHFVSIDKVLSHDYPRYLPMLEEHFTDFDIAGLVTWHGGKNAPRGILTAHTTGDVASGNFGPADPARMRALLAAIERNRATAGLEGFRVLPEATHWSGAVYDGGSPSLIPRYPVPLLDIEIGSEPESWSNPEAARVIARSLTEIFAEDGRRVRNLLCAGGIHFEPSFAAAVFQAWGESAFGISHILANQWLVSGGYEGGAGLARLAACADSIRGGIEGIAFHDNLKGVYKDQLRELGRARGVPVFKHQVLRRPDDIPWRPE